MAATKTQSGTFHWCSSERGYKQKWL